MEIKFKAWNNTHKCWISECGINTNGKLNLLIGNFGDIGFGYTDICLFTGMKDSNGVEIYFGDIIKCWDSDTTKPIYKYGSVIYLYDLALWYIDGELMESLTDWKLLGNVEVVGNIYENNLSDFATREYQTLTWQQIQEGYKEYELHKYDGVY